MRQGCQRRMELFLSTPEANWKKWGWWAQYASSTATSNKQPDPQQSMGPRPGFISRTFILPLRLPFQDGFHFLGGSVSQPAANTGAPGGVNLSVGQRISGTPRSSPASTGSCGGALLVGLKLGPLATKMLRPQCGIRCYPSGTF